jgi:hypothetical protein
MKSDQISRCKELIKQYFEKKRKAKARNQLFLELSPYISKWLITSLAPKNMFLTSKEALSLSWDCFEFCLKHYKYRKSSKSGGKPIPIPNHFYSYTKFYAANYHHNKKKEDRIVSFDDPNSTPDLGFMQIEELKSFHSFLDKNYKSIFEDAIDSMSNSNWNRKRRLGETSVSYVRYCESKKVFKWVIDFLIKR